MLLVASLEVGIMELWRERVLGLAVLMTLAGVLLFDKAISLIFD
jgi:hypothetical protein